MCGIAGKLYFDKARIITRSELKKMTDVIGHRGPDDEGYYFHENVGLGFRRLSIIDLTTGHQPLSNEDDTVWIVFNGEIYNFLDLRNHLVKTGHVFRTKTDTEVIVHLYEQYGSDCLKYLRGMFSFAIYDMRNRRIFCARDRFGEKPFYYLVDNNKFIFGSELKVILKNDDIDKTINLNALDDYFTYGYIVGNKSIYKNIHKLPAAHYLEINISESNSIEINPYWNIIFKPDYTKTESDWESEIISTLSDSVKRQMISDVPLGAFLSGGIDSSSIVALMAKNSTKRIKTFSIGFKENEYNELDFAREVSEKYNTEHYEQIVEPESIDLLPKLVKAYDEPFADSSAIPTYYVSKFAREHVTVVLSGDGGDELFAGYNAYSRLHTIQKFQVLPDKINKMFYEPVYRLLPYSMRGKKVFFYASKPTNELGVYFTMWNHYERKKLYRPEFWNAIVNLTSEKFKTGLLDDLSSDDFISRLQELDIKTYLVDDILTKVDRASMLNSLEVRVPLLDFKFAELTFKIPSTLKFHHGVKKHIFKKAMKEHLPEGVLNHKKQGFAVPLKLWFRKDLNDYINEKLLKKDNFISGYLKTNEIKNILKKSEYGGRNLGPNVWSLLFLEAWLDYSNTFK